MLRLDDSFVCFKNIYSHVCARKLNIEDKCLSCSDSSSSRVVKVIDRSIIDDYFATLEESDTEQTVVFVWIMSGLPAHDTTRCYQQIDEMVKL